MLESTPELTLSQKQESAVNQEQIKRPPHLDVVTLMKERNCFFVHMIQVNKNLDVSENNKSLDTKKLDNADKLDILYGANPTLSVSSVRPNTQDGTFYGGFGVLLSQGEVISANPSDDGTIAKSLTEREIIGGPQNSKDDIDRAINRNHIGKDKLYNEIVLKQPEVAGGFMKIDSETFKGRISYEDFTQDYGAGGGEVTTKIGTLNLSNVEDGPRFDIPFSMLIEMKKRGPVYLMDEHNQMLTVIHIDEQERNIEFSLTPVTPSNIAKMYGDKTMNKYVKQEMRERLKKKGILLN